MVIKSNTGINSIPGVQERSALWQAFPQILATCVKNVLLLGFGMTLGFPTILIPSLSAKAGDTNETFSLGQEAISWIGSINLICVPVGCLLSGAITQPIGRKRAMQFVNLPFLAAWLLFYYSTEVWHVFLALALTGMSGGLLEAPVLTYVAEITQPHLRGALSATSSMSVTLGTLVQFLLGTFFDWRTVALVSSAAPFVAFTLLFFVPETPIWLISKDRFVDARKSLAWLRGWANVNEVEEEFQEILKDLNKKECDNNLNENIYPNLKTGRTQETNKKLSKIELLKLFTKKNFIWPYTLISFSFFLSHFGGMTPIQTFAIKIFSTLDVPIDKYYATVMLGTVAVIGCVICLGLVHYLGKRKLGLFSLFSSGTCLLIVAFYCNIADIKYLMKPVTNNQNVTLENQTILENFTTMAKSEFDVKKYSWIPLVLIILISFTSYVGTRILPWILTGEVFSNETRAIGAGLGAAVSYVFGFLSNKIFLSTISNLTLAGTFWFYSGVNFVGIILLYFFLPETEGKTLQQIGDHFSGVAKLDNTVCRRRKRPYRGETNPGYDDIENSRNVIVSKM